MPWRKIKTIFKGEGGPVVYVAGESEVPGGPVTKLVVVKTSNDLETLSSEESDLRKRELGLLDIFRGDPFVVQCFGWDQSEENGKSCFNILMEFAREGALNDLVYHHVGILPEKQIAYYAYMILKGLSSIHSKEIVHCDVKPENILVFKTEQGFTQLKLTDFGQSRYLNKVSDKLRYRGTPIYFSPECVNSGIHGKAGDVWAFGCTVLYMMLGGKSIWGDSNISNQEVLKRIVKEAPRIPESVSDVGRDFLKLCFTDSHKTRPAVEMLLRHRFIRENIKGMLPPNGFEGKVANPFGRRIAAKGLFSTNSADVKQ